MTAAPVPLSEPPPPRPAGEGATSPAADGGGSLRLSPHHPLTRSLHQLLAGPIFQKEVRVAGRRKGTYWLRGLYTIALLALVSFAFAASTSELGTHYSTTGVARLQQLQAIAPEMLITIAWFQFIIIGLLAPLLTSGGISDEKRAGTLAALMTTPLTSLQIIVGKLTSRLVQITILVLIAAPLLLAIRIFGGLDTETVLGVTAVTLSTAVLGAALGLMFSVWHTRSAAAGIFAILTLVLLQAGPFSLDMLIRYWMHVPVMPDASMVTCAAMPMAMFTEGQQGMPPGIVPLSPTTLWLGNTAYNLATAVLIVLFSAVRLRRVMLDQAAGQPAPARVRRRSEPTPGCAAGLGKDQETPSAAPESVATASRIDAHHRQLGDNPILWRELRQPWISSRRGFFGAVAIVAAGLGFLYYQVGMDETNLHAALAIVGILAVLFQAGFAATNAISGEREARTLDTLLTTPLHASAIIRGKLAGALRRQWFAPLVLAAHFFTAVALGHVQPSFLLHLLLIAGGPLLFLTATGLLFSAFFRRTTLASAINLFLGLALWAGVPFGIIIAQEIGGYRGDWDAASNAAFVINPVAMIASAAQVECRGYPAARFDPFYIGSDHESRPVFNTIVFTTAAAYTAAAAAAAALSIAAFRLRSGRTS
jgi:ABC-type transport system involved in multi-copper enzyme maturation permease subunit